MTGAKRKMFVMACMHLWAFSASWLAPPASSTMRTWNPPVRRSNSVTDLSSTGLLSPSNLYTVPLPSPPSTTDSPSMSNTSTKSADLTPKPLRTISTHDDWHSGIAAGIAYLPGEERLVTCSPSYGTVRIWNVENGEQEGMEMEHGSWVEGFAVTKDGRRMLSGDEHGLLKVWDLETHQPIAEWGGHEAIITCIAMSRDDQLVASGDNKGRI
ncbi:hypothetical protein PAXINDRAFT_16158, partial [Paxillus involutus ATCC 200175]